MWIKRTGEPEKKHHCNKPMAKMTDPLVPEVTWPVADGRIGDVWLCDICNRVWAIAPDGDYGHWVLADWWTARKARKKSVEIRAGKAHAKCATDAANEAEYQADALFEKNHPRSS